MNQEENVDFAEIHQELDRLKHSQDGHGDSFECYGTFRCPCGCKQLITCPGGQLCRARIMRLKGNQQAKAVRE